jgi:hypothetical protein
MSDTEQSRSWWQTLPGIITGLTATVTALAGLVVAIQQTGWLKGRTPQGVSSPPVVTPAAPGSTPAIVPPQEPRAGVPTATPDRAAHAVRLPAMREYKLGASRYTLVRADVAPRSTEKDDLTIRLRMMNDGRYDQNFWDRSFRLVVDGVPMAPEGGLNELVPSRSAKEGEVLFVLPRGTASVTLTITAGDESTDVPLDLSPPS